MENLETQRQIHKAQMVYKSLNGLAPNYLSSKFIQRSDIITSSDSENKLAVPLPPAPITIKIVSAIVVQFYETVCRLLQAKSLPNFRLMLNVSVISDIAFMEESLIFLSSFIFYVCRFILITSTKLYLYLHQLYTV